MKMDTSLKPQDKKTIAIVVYIAVVALFCWYMIRPAWLKLSELDDKIEQATATQQEYKMKSINLGTAEILYDKAVTDITDSTVDFYDVMDNSEIEKMGTEYILSFGLTPVDFIVDLRDGTYVIEAPYQYADIQVNQPAAVTEDYTATDDENADTSEGNDNFTAALAGLDVQSLQVYYSSAVGGVTTTEPAEVQCARITIVVTGPEAKCQELIDDITKNPSIRVTGFAWSNTAPVYVTDAEGNQTLVNAGYKQLRIDLNLYMTDKPQFESEEG